jgi:hypothetical protein
VDIAAFVVSLLAAVVSLGAYWASRRSADEAKRANDFTEAADRDQKLARVRVVGPIKFFEDQGRLGVAIDFQNGGPAPARELSYTLELGRGGEPSRHVLTSIPTETVFANDTRTVRTETTSQNSNVMYFRGRSILQVTWKDDLSDTNVWQQEGWVEGMMGNLEFFFDSTGPFRKVH